jgi:hypothetical protein
VFVGKASAVEEESTWAVCWCHFLIAFYRR